MRYAGVSWGAHGYEVGVLDAGGGGAAPVRFGPDQIAEMISYLRGTGEPFTTVVESTCGILDGRMMAAGIPVYRADPEVLPPRPVFGSVPAADLARAAYRDLSALTRLEPTGGTQTGRAAFLQAGFHASAPALAALTAQRRCLAHGRRDRPEVALTFDDGPQQPYTGQVLDVLLRHGVPATFFCVGLHATGYPDVIARIRAEGHGLGNHTWSHPFLPELTRPQLAEQLTRTGEVLATAAGAQLPGLFRPPYGSRSPEVLGWLRETVPTIVLWDVEAEDWAMPGADAIAQIVLDEVRPGSIILLHDGGGNRSQTVAALPRIITGLQERGYRFVRVEDLVASAAEPVARAAGHAAEPSPAA